MTQTTTTLGYVVGRFVGHDGEPVPGEVRFTPHGTTLLPQATPPATATPRGLTATIGDDGRIGPLGLVPAVYEVAPQIVGAGVARFLLDLRAEHTLNNPADLTLEAPLRPSPAVQFVVNETVHREALAAREAALASALDAARAVIDAATQRAGAESARDAAQDHARAAAAEVVLAAAEVTRAAAEVSRASEQASRSSDEADRSRDEADRSLSQADRAGQFAALAEGATWGRDPLNPKLIRVTVPDHWVHPDNPNIIRLSLPG